ncbi:DUF6528 family protein [Paenibacillus hamazuiensis]|uniref:DUF6528 family protein n=1 Tax=Paenibacillus hamazuiensis TaxID=2936508 RepID=UPI00200CB64A|nr:DUF6528 family protein [Paenibacillus hamazuiensis]
MKWIGTSRLGLWLAVVLTAAVTLSALLQGIGPNPAKAGTGDYDIAMSEQSTDKILVMDPNAADWNSSSAVKWSWAPTTSNGFSGLTAYWGTPTEARLRNSSFFGGQVMLVTDSKGLAGIIPYPAGNAKLWAANVGGNPHAAELLPNGNVAIAASTGGWVRVYTSSQSSTSATYAEYSLPSAHGVLWDPAGELLWTIGNAAIVGLKVGGTAAAPTLTEQVRLDVTKLNGHDIQPVYGDTDRLWVASGGKVYQYVKSTNSLDLTYAGASSISRVGVKSVGNQVSGQVVETVTDTAKSPPGACSTVNNWCTDTVDMFLPDATRTRTGAVFYKARIMNPNYQ